VCLGVVSKESILIRSIFLHEWAEGWVGQEGFVSWQLKKAFLLTTQELLEVRVVEDQRVGGPGSLKAGSLLVAPSQGVTTRKRNNVLVAQTHLGRKDLPEVVRTLGGIRKAAFWRRLRLVLSTRVEGNLRSAGDLDGHDSSKLVEVSVGEGGELFLDGLEKANGDVEAGVGAVGELGGALHGAEGAAGLGGDIEGASGVPPAYAVSDRGDRSEGDKPRERA